MDYNPSGGVGDLSFELKSPGQAKNVWSESNSLHDPFDFDPPGRMFIPAFHYLPV